MEGYLFHRPVLLDEAVGLLNVKSGGIYVDATIGGGGHAYEILKNTAPDGVLVGIDRDKDALDESGRRLNEFSGRLYLSQSSFSEIKSVLMKFHIEEVDGILADLGVSSHQLNTAARGFSFSVDAPLDMRMDDRDVLTAQDIVNTYPEDELRHILRNLGEEVQAGKISRAIVARRKESPICSTSELAALVAEVVSSRRGHRKIHPATKTFQALRIAVNEELKHLEKALADSMDVLKKGGRICIISFHSLEDRIVKNFFRDAETGCTCPKNFPVCTCHKVKKLQVVTRHAVKAGEAEKAGNPRARSARLRAAEKV
ncbi:MAG: 16S rRNA (cytosine(1402)-N(4))-methyltransferase RsmH [Syntrophales bacterium]|jgi:16S rRNA (cytosine1402-N4)-methyltransferase|nr:16S rRNA (cytosine(1402)-N(4))-methyltransferase RsmH [Syntrophales bacterium]MDY0043063.1 16S rRNA (cytosine(1402)-N(4))-methyltransferase RsmH [Syntrophales bacterium]